MISFLITNNNTEKQTLKFLDRKFYGDGLKYNEEIIKKLVDDFDKQNIEVIVGSTNVSFKEFMTQCGYSNPKRIESLVLELLDYSSNIVKLNQLKNKVLISHETQKDIFMSLEKRFFTKFFKPIITDSFVGLTDLQIDIEPGCTISLQINLQK